MVASGGGPLGLVDFDAALSGEELLHQGFFLRCELL
jgi:hypothetical protein